MAMTILNNTGTTKSLGQLNKNINAMGKVLVQSASGMKINGADDDASGYSISEKMQAQLRSLEQDVQNVRTGKNLINTAAGGIDEIIQELRNLKNLAINAANDHNSDLDRATLQKEFDQRMENIDDIASTTNYNGKLLLNGDYERYRKAWIAEYKDEEVDPPEAPEQLDVIEPNDPPIIIENGDYTIRTAGVYILGTNYSGTINIENDLVGVKIKQAGVNALKNVHINGPSKGKANLWIEGLNIDNTHTDDGSWIKFSGNGNVLSIKGNNTFSIDKDRLYRQKAVINIGGGLTLQGNGSLNCTVWYPDGAIIGTDVSEQSNANIVINSGTYTMTTGTGRNNNTMPGGGYGAIIGSGKSGSVGEIMITGGVFDLYDTGGGACIGSGGAMGTAGNVIIQNAEINAITDDGACIGSGLTGSRVGNIIIEDSTINVESKRLFKNISYEEIGTINYGCGSGIGSGGDRSDAGNITIRNSNVTAASYRGAGIGSGWKSNAGNITIENMNGTATSITGEDIGKGELGSIGGVDSGDGGNSGQVSYREETVLGTPLIIHNGTRSNQALRCFIPNMHTKNMGLENISITSQQSAQSLLGDPHNTDEPGILDKAIDYALDAATGMGSYVQELNASEDNLVTNSENTQASESTIRDADMARTALDYAKSNILSQASQSMLAQANQNTSSVLSLLGG